MHCWQQIETTGHTVRLQDEAENTLHLTNSAYHIYRCVYSRRRRKEILYGRRPTPQTHALSEHIMVKFILQESQLKQGLADRTAKTAVLVAI